MTGELVCIAQRELQFSAGYPSGSLGFLIFDFYFPFYSIGLLFFECSCEFMRGDIGGYEEKKSISVINLNIFERNSLPVYVEF